MNQSANFDRRAFGKSLAGAAALVALLPQSALASPTSPDSSGGGVQVSPGEFGAKGDGVANDTAALQKAIDHCAAAGGGTVFLEPRATYLSGGLKLRSHVTLHLSGGTVLLASANRAEFHETGALLFAKDEADLRITGTGVIDGNFKAFFEEKGPEGYKVPQPFLGPYDPLLSVAERNPVDGRPRMILLLNCRGTRMENFTVRNSPTWTIHPIGCEDLRITGISILNGLDVPNCDGIDIDHCRQVRVEGCNIVAGDDCLIVKASRNFGDCGPCEGVTITNCTLESSSAAIKIEPEGPYPVRSVVISNCTIRNSNRGISILNRDGALVEDLLFSNLVINTTLRTAMWWGSGEPVAVSSFPREKGGAAGTLRNVSFSNLICRGESGILVRGIPETKLQGVSFRNIDMVIEKTTEIPGGFYDLRPGSFFGASGLEHRKIAGVYACDVDGLTLEGVSVQWTGRIPDYFGPALELRGCTNTRLNQVFGKAADDSPATVFEQVSWDKPIAPKA